MNKQILSIASALILFHAPLALAGSPAERNARLQNLSFQNSAENDVSEPEVEDDAPVAKTSAKPSKSTSKTEEKPKEPAPNSCNGSSWYSPLIQATGSILGGILGSYAGDGVGQHAATIAGGAVGTVAMNQAVKAACEGTQEPKEE